MFKRLAALALTFAAIASAQLQLSSHTINVTPTAAGTPGGATAGYVSFWEKTNTYHINLSAPTSGLSSNVSLSLPVPTGTAGCWLDNGAGVTTIGSCSGGSLTPPVTLSASSASSILTLTNSGAGNALEVTAGGIQFDTFSTGIVHSSSAGLLSSSAVNLASSDVSGILPVANGGTGSSSAGLTAGTGISIGGTWPNQIIGNQGVTSVNGSTGGISNIAVTNAGQTFSGSQQFNGSVLINLGGSLGLAFAGMGILHTSGLGGTVSASAVNLAGSDVSGILPVTSGGTGSSSAGLTAGSGISISGTWPNNTIGNSGVTSVNGATGGISNIAVTNAGQTFSGSQQFNGSVLVNLGGSLGLAFAGTGVVHTSGLGGTVSSSKVVLTSEVSGILPIANGGTGASSAGLTAGTGISISGTWPNNTIGNQGVTSVNGSTGGISNIAVTNAGQTFSGGTQQFSTAMNLGFGSTFTVSGALSIGSLGSLAGTHGQNIGTGDNPSFASVTSNQFGSSGYSFWNGSTSAITANQFNQNSNAGVTCSGAPSGSFATSGGIVTHC